MDLPTSPPNQPPSPAQSALSSAREALVTLEPYVPRSLPDPNAQNQRRPHRQRQKLHERYQRQHQLLSSNVQDEYTKFFTIRSVSVENLASIDTIRANREITNLLGGQPKRILETRAGCLSVEVASRSQSLAMQRLTELSTVRVTVNVDTRLNQTKGTIRYQNRPGYDTDVLLQELRAYKATEIYQMKKKVDGILRPLPTYIVTFDSCNLPPEVNIGWTKCPVRLYIPRP